VKIALCTFKAPLTVTNCARVGAETGYLLVPIIPQDDASGKRLHGVATGTAPVGFSANKHAADSSFLENGGRLMGSNEMTKERN